MARRDSGVSCMPDLPTGPGKKILDQVRRTQQDHPASEAIDSPHQQYLSFLLNEDWYGLSVYDLVEVLPPPKITPLRGGFGRPSGAIFPADPRRPLRLSPEDSTRLQGHPARAEDVSHTSLRARQHVPSRFSARLRTSGILNPDRAAPAAFGCNRLCQSAFPT